MESIVKRAIIDDKYFIDIDERNFMLRSDLSVDKKGRERYVHIGYFGNMESLINKLIKMHMIDNLKTVGTLQEMKQTLDVSKKYIKNICTELGL